jgi:hypothetical protein
MAFLTTAVNVLAMATAVWLGFYIVTRSARNHVSWLAALTLWTVASYFLHNVVAINVPGSGMLPYLRPGVVIAFPLLFHLTVDLLPDRSLWWLWKLSPWAGRAVILLAYGLALFIIVSGATPGDLAPEAKIGMIVYLDGRTTGTFYPLVPALLVLLVSQSVLNLWQGQRHVADKALRDQFTVLLVATILAAVAGLYITLGIWLQLHLPTLPGDVTLGIALVLLGYAVAQYNAFIEVRTIKRDFTYSSLVVALLTLFYYLAALILYFAGHISFVSLTLVIVVAISSHALYDGIRVTMDRLFYQEQLRRLRANLTALAREAGAGQPLPEQLQEVLRSLCRTLRIRRGFIALRSEDGEEEFVIHAQRGLKLQDETLPLPALSCTEIIQLPQPDVQPPGDMALLVPLFAGGTQLGVLALGPKENHRHYWEDDLMVLEDLSDQLANVIHTSRLQTRNAHAIGEIVADFRARERALQQQVHVLLREREEQTKPVLDGMSEKQFQSLVEDGLRRLHDYPYLGQHTLAHLNVVNWVLKGWSDAFVTHIDRGKALNEVLLQALHKLRPEGTEPPAHQIPTREWHQFLVLHDAYVLGVPNRDIMSRLYVGEGTFNRTRRRALRGVAQALAEMERLAQQQVREA